MFVLVYMFIFWIYLPFWEKPRSLCLSEFGLLHLTTPIASIYLQTTYVIPPYGEIKLRVCVSVCVVYVYDIYISYFLDSFISCRASGLFTWFDYCEQCYNNHCCASVSIVSWSKFLWIYARNSITGPYGSATFSILSILNTASHNGWTDLNSHQQCIRVPVSPHSCQYFLLIFLLKMVILAGVSWNLSVLLICISFMAREVEHFFIYLLVICSSSF
jgi:hypothetical protein